MLDLNYFEILCYFWAILGLGSRFFMIALGEKWNDWETSKAYSEKKPVWIYIVGIFGIMLVVYTWYQVYISDIAYDWVLAILVSFTLIKVFSLLFNYKKFRAFIVETLNNKKKLTQINISVAILSVVFILMGIFLY